MPRPVKTPPPPVPIDIREDHPPEPQAWRGLQPQTEEVLAKAKALQPGQWFVWPNPPSRWKIIAEKHLAEVPVKVYSTYGKRVVVRHWVDAALAAPASPKQAPAAKPAADRRAATPPAVVPARVDDEEDEPTPDPTLVTAASLTTREAAVVRVFGRDPGQHTMPEITSRCGWTKSAADEIQKLLALKVLMKGKRADDRTIFALTNLGCSILQELTGPTGGVGGAGVVGVMGVMGGTRP